METNDRRFAADAEHLLLNVARRELDVDRAVAAETLTGSADDGPPKTSAAVFSGLLLAQAREAWCHGSGDRELGALLFDYHLLTGSRPAGAEDLTLSSIDRDRQLIWLSCRGMRRASPSGRDVGVMPVPKTLCDRLVALAQARGAGAPGDRVLRCFHGRVLARPGGGHREACCWRTLERVWNITGVRFLRRAGAARVAELADPGRGRAVQLRYLRRDPDQVKELGYATLEELARVIVRWTGHPHPLAE